MEGRISRRPGACLCRSLRRGPRRGVGWSGYRYMRNLWTMILRKLSVQDQRIRGKGKGKYHCISLSEEWTGF